MSRGIFHFLSRKDVVDEQFRSRWKVNEFFHVILLDSIFTVEIWVVATRTVVVDQSTIIRNFIKTFLIYALVQSLNKNSRE